MKTFRCFKCELDGGPCTLTLEETCNDPERCPFPDSGGKWDAEWVEADEDLVKEIEMDKLICMEDIFVERPRTDDERDRAVDEGRCPKCGESDVWTHTERRSVALCPRCGYRFEG